MQMLMTDNTNIHHLCLIVMLLQNYFSTPALGSW